MSPQQHDTFRAEVEKLIAADQQVSIFEYMIRCVLNRHLDANFNPKSVIERALPAALLADNVAVVLSFLAWEGADEEPAARAAFDLGMKALGDAVGQREFLTREKCTLPAFDSGLRLLGQSRMVTKRLIVNACGACIAADGKVTVREGELLRAICAVLGCPMPPLLMSAPV